MNTENEEMKNSQIKKVERYRWLIWLILAATYVFVTFHRMSTTIIKDDLQKAFRMIEIGRASCRERV